MADRSGGGVGGFFAVVLMAACCGLPALVALGAGAAGAIGGLAARYWPLTVLGVGVLVWASVRLWRVARERSRRLKAVEDRRE